MKMNIANKLTLLRVFLAPFFVIFMVLENIPNHYVWALVIFVISAFTDFLDGSIARRYNLITEFGKFLDPLADKVLTTAALICFVELGWMQGWALVIIISREFLVSGVRLIAAGKKVVIAADVLGKIKTALTMITIIVILIFQIIIQNSGNAVNSTLGIELFLFISQCISYFLIYSVVAITVISGISYIVKNKNVFIEDM